jgi:hypothetical protein
MGIVSLLTLNLRNLDWSEWNVDMGTSLVDFISVRTGSVRSIHCIT